MIPMAFPIFLLYPIRCGLKIQRLPLALFEVALKEQKPTDDVLDF
jgi:hypothetical protein